MLKAKMIVNDLAKKCFIVILQHVLDNDKNTRHCYVQLIIVMVNKPAEWLPICFKDSSNLN